MANETTYGAWYEDLDIVLDTLQENIIYDDMTRLLEAGRSSVSMNRKLMEKSIDVSWVEAIENGLIHVDNVVRNPSRTIIDEEEVVPIALSRKITVESVKHLAQHTDLIQSVDPKTGKITPSKILNIHKEESLATYENRFVNTLIDRLYIFIMTRYEKLSEVDKDEEVYAFNIENSVDDQHGTTMKIKVSIDAQRNLEATNDSGYTIWQRVEKLKKTIEGYKGSELCTTLGNNFIQPPVMRTNAIMKNIDLKACLVLWQYILSYDKVGYEINVEDTAVRPNPEYVADLNRLLACELLLFKTYSEEGEKAKEYTPLGTKKFKSIQPKVVKQYGSELLSGHYDIQTTESVGYVQGDGLVSFVNANIPDNSDEIFTQIDKALQIERNFYDEKERKRLEELAIAEEAERRRQEREARLEEKRRIEEAKREERERIRREKEEEEKRVQEMLERRRAEIEAEERERARIEAERQARLEEERRIAEEEARIQAEKEKLRQEKAAIRSDLGDAEGVDAASVDKQKEAKEKMDAYNSVTWSDIAETERMMEEQAEAAAEKAAENAEEIVPEEEPEDPRAVAARMKFEQQQREKEQREKDRALRLKAERAMYEAKPFEKIRREYSRNPIYVIPRFFVWLLFKLFGHIPPDTDNPDWKRILAERAERIRQEEYERGEREKFEVYYAKYATNFPYNIKRYFADQKFKRKKAKEAKNRPKPKYTPPVRTEEEQRAIRRQMRTLYRTYHVTIFMWIWRKVKEAVEKQDDDAIQGSGL